ncbi:hypothetical protein TWF192_010034 [Orbilia oligospora]|uniref:Thioredoxin domain-containing protein n=1 Tax=Orbilia oligospora TaxID=2813651 RepID=A0A6G1M0M9_ORBOL|nr:hypothetical protein TWF679_000088 [Orbilia oligospora]KAF3232273.1 hypothetical protein TWF191_000045 [Orbilia oligospora]KAF3239339.1 hypothetical protein TWF192_010034 [Orbilia oligospora]
MVIKHLPPTSLSLTDPTTTLQTYLETLSQRPLYIFFIASSDPVTNTPWCPDVRAAIPVFNRVFEEVEEELLVVTVEVGGKDEWKDANNVFRTEWGVGAIPTVGKYSIIDVEGQSIVAVRMLVENDCADEEKLRAFIN